MYIVNSRTTLKFFKSIIDILEEEIKRIIKYSIKTKEGKKRWGEGGEDQYFLKEEIKSKVFIIHHSQYSIYNNKITRHVKK